MSAKSKSKSKTKPKPNKPAKGGGAKKTAKTKPTPPEPTAPPVQPDPEPPPAVADDTAGDCKICDGHGHCDVPKGRGKTKRVERETCRKCGGSGKAVQPTPAEPEPAAANDAVPESPFVPGACPRCDGTGQLCNRCGESEAVCQGDCGDESGEGEGDDLNLAGHHDCDDCKGAGVQTPPVEPATPAAVTETPPVYPFTEMHTPTVSDADLAAYDHETLLMVNASAKAIGEMALEWAAAHAEASKQKKALDAKREEHFELVAERGRQRGQPRQADLFSKVDPQAAAGMHSSPDTDKRPDDWQPSITDRKPDEPEDLTWRLVTLREMVANDGLPVKVCTIMEENGMKTLGDVVDYTTADPVTGWQNRMTEKFDGFGPKKQEAWEDACLKFWERWPKRNAGKDRGDGNQDDAGQPGRVDGIADASPPAARSDRDEPDESFDDSDDENDDENDDAETDDEDGEKTE